MSWEKVKLGDVCDLFAGGDCPKVVSKIRTEKYSVPIYSNGLQEEGLYGYTDKAKISGDTITLTARGANSGIVFFRKEPFLPIVRLISIIPNKEILNSKYLYYLLKTKIFVASKTGAAQPQITIPAVANEEILYETNKKTQKRIADILSAYDDLIENNQKQIKLLEEAAQRLYKQWFIDLKFPGHETTKIIDGLPEGWKTVQIQDVCKNIGAGGTPSRSQKNFWENGNIDWFKTQELCDCWLFEASEKISEEGLKRSAAKMFPANSILMAIYASPTLGRLGILTKEACSNQAALCLQADESKVSNYWLYLKLFELRERFNSIARGAGQQNISGIIVKETEIALPSYSIMQKFTEMVKPFFEKQKILQLQNISLTQTRDRLLPKLMKNEI